jgi:hypothetical protein
VSELIKLGAEVIAAAMGKKLFGPTFDVMGNDIKQAYVKGVNKVFEKATEKTDVNKPGKTNLRVSMDVLRNGTYTDEEICAEYFGGILAASRNENGDDDSGIFYLDIIKSLSSDQLKMHYIIYRTFNKYLLTGDKKSFNAGLIPDLDKEAIYFPLIKIVEQFRSVDPGAILHSLYSKDLIGEFFLDPRPIGEDILFPYLRVSPTAIGIQLFAIAYNQFSNWRKISTFDFGDFDDVELPNFYAQSLNEFLLKAGYKEKK